MSKTPIQWTDHSINPIKFRNLETGKVGHHCEKVSPGCKNCYASKLQTPYLSGLTYIAENTSKGEYIFDDAALQQVLRRKKPTKFFWCDMTDMFGSWVPDEWIDRCFATMALTPQHTHQVLTKRADRMREWASSKRHEPNSLSTFQSLAEALYKINSGDPRLARYGGVDPLRIAYDITMGKSGGWWPLPNVWLGVSIEDQPYADKRIPDLLATPAAVRFVSYEPALGPVDFERCYREHSGDGLCDHEDSGIDWIIVGGESGPGPCARPFDIAWARSVISQAALANISVFFKQAGARPVLNGTPLNLKDRKGGELFELPEDVRVREFPW